MRTACDYAVAFVDLLGQKDALRERHLPENQEKAIQIIKNSVGKIIGTQKRFETFYQAFTSRQTLYSQLPKQLQDHLPDLAPAELKWQRFSDGFVIYIPLGDGLAKESRMARVYSRHAGARLEPWIRPMWILHKSLERAVLD